MAYKNTQEERQLLKLVENLPVAEEDRSRWTERIRNGEMSAELAEEIRAQLAAPAEAEENQGSRARYLADLTNLVRRWRLSSQSHNFSKK